MNLKNSSIFFGKLILLTIIYTVCFVLGTMISGLAEANPGSDDQSAGSALLFLTANSFLTATLFAWLTIRTRWPKWKSLISLFLLLFFIGTLLPQLDSLFFSNALELSIGEVGTIIFSGAISAFLYIPISVWLLSSKQEFGVSENGPITQQFPYQKIGSLSLIYVVIYYLFGYFVAWQSADLRVFYSGSSEIQPFWIHLRSTWESSPSLFGLQILRGLIWAGLAYLIGSMVVMGKWTKVLTIALVFSLTGILLLLLPNPYMPEQVRQVHFVEVVSSNFLFGFIAGSLLFIRKLRSKP